MDIQRDLALIIEDRLRNTQNIIVIYGARQVGKTTLVNNLVRKLGLKTIVVNGDELKYRDVFSSRDWSKLQSFLEGYELLFIDEAQKIPDIGLNLKIIYDNAPWLKVIVTGSSAFDLTDQLAEPLTGRSLYYMLYPIAQSELAHSYNRFELHNQLEQSLLFGAYPRLFSLVRHDLKIEYIQNIYNAYLFKDIFELASLRHGAKINNLVKLLAFQVGQEVSVNELATVLGITRSTVEYYISLLERSFVVFRLSGFSRNLRKEITKMDKIYFCDLGVRNAAIDNFRPLADRNDVGQLWENFLILERRKMLHYKTKHASGYFWRTYTGAELDYLEESDGALRGYEFKWGSKGAKVPSGFLSAYPNASFELVNQNNYLSFII